MDQATRQLGRYRRIFFSNFALFLWKNEKIICMIFPVGTLNPNQIKKEGITPPEDTRHSGNNTRAVDDSISCNKLTAIAVTNHLGQ